jgi:DNA-binding NarL/FixJ family response regulator
MTAIRILLADDHHVVADGLRMLLASVDDFEIVGIVNNGWQVLDFLEHNEVDVVLADHHMPLLTGLEMATKVKERALKTRIVMLTMNEEARCIRDALEVGVAGYVVKNIEKPELVRAIRAVHGGDQYLSSRLVRKLAAEANGPAQSSPAADIMPLTPREIEILKLVTSDLSNIAIGDRLNISTTTVETHRRNLMKKLGVSTAVGLMRWGIRHGLVDGL